MHLRCVDTATAYGRAGFGWAASAAAVEEGSLMASPRQVRRDADRAERAGHHDRAAYLRRLIGEPKAGRR